MWQEDGERRQCESVSEEKLAAKLEKVRQRLAVGASNMTESGADLIAWYLNPDRLPVADRWSRKHADTQRQLCRRFAAPVINAVACQDITTRHTQKIVNAAPTAGEGDRVHRTLSAVVSAGIKGGYLVNPMLAGVHWEAGDRSLSVPKATVAGESALLVDSSEIPSSGDARSLGRALAARSDGERDELMANLAAYSGLRWGELTALTIGQILHHGAAHLEARRHRRIEDGRACQLPHHPRHVRRNNSRRPRPSPHSHRVSTRPNYPSGPAGAPLPAGPKYHSGSGEAQRRQLPGLPRLDALGPPA